METLKIYYSPDIGKLFQFKETANFYLPEIAEVKPKVSAMYQPGNIIATTSLMTLEIIKELIISQKLQASKVLFIEIIGKSQKICTFTEDGTIKSFFIFPWESEQ